MPRPDFPRTVLEFQKRFAAEDACLEYLIASRWPEGFVCARCGSTDAWWKASRRLFECKACRYQASVTAGTVIHRSRMPLRLWFWAAYLAGPLGAPICPPTPSPLPDGVPDAPQAAGGDGSRGARAAAWHRRGGRGVYRRRAVWQGRSGRLR